MHKVGMLWALAPVLLLASALPARAQVGGEDKSVVAPAPDPNGVDLVTGGFSIPEPTVDIPAAGHLQVRMAHHEGTSISSNMRVSISAAVDLEGIWHDEMTAIPEWPRIYSATVDGVTRQYLCWYADAASCDQRNARDGSFLEFINYGQDGIVLVTGDGTRVTFPMLPGEYDTQNADKGLSYANDIVYPSGEKVAFSYAYTPNDGQGPRTTATSNLGYSVFITNLTRTRYKGSTVISTITVGSADASTSTDFTRVFTDDLGRQAKVRYMSPAHQFQWGGYYTFALIDWADDPAGTRTDYEYRLTGGYYDTGYYRRTQVQTLTRNSKTWTYAYNAAERSVTRPDSTTAIFGTEHASGMGFVGSTVTPSGKTTQYGYTGWDPYVPWKIASTTMPEGNKLLYAYDTRGNLTSTTQVGKAGTASRIVYEASFPSTCTNPKTCNKPVWTKDSAGAQTDYTYDSTHGGLVTKLEPAGANGFRRKLWNEYAAYDTGSGTIYRLSAAHSCSVYSNGTNNDCGTATDNVVTYTYWEKTFLPLTATQTNGTGSVSAVTTNSYDFAGRLASTSDPTGIARYFRYDAVGRKTWEIAPNASGSFIARRLTYDASDRVTRVDTGTIPSSGSTSLTITSSVTHVYDADGNRTKSTFLDASETKMAQRQMSYDALSRPVCSVRRMNPAAFDATSDACTVGTAGSYGPDRISKNVYNIDGQVTKRIEGYGVLNSGAGDAVVETAYTNNGQVQWQQDGNANRTNYAYDDYDRAWRITFPDSSQEFTEYNSVGRLWKSTKRDGSYSTITYGGDGLPSSTAFSNGESSVSNTYDGHMRLLTTTQGSNTLSVTYDALGRRASAQSNGQQFSYLYDLAGRRTRTTHPDSFYATYEYDAAGNPSVVKENGSTALVTFGYDTLGRRTSITRGNGANTAITYDAATRISSFGQDLASSGTDLTLGFAWNPASDVITETRSNDSYSWTGHTNVARSYTTNNLNQYSAAGAVSLSYDGRGNLTQSGSSSYTYGINNHLLTAPGTTLSYDPSGRLLRAQGSSATTRFLYDGNALTVETNDSGTVLRRYVHGFADDEPLVWYEGSGTSDKRWLHADEQGSIVAASNGSGTSIGTNTYDEYGIPGSGNIGRFQYTGQVWLADLGMYYYKARIYSPTLGRFLQTDPAGYKDGMNLYAYTGNDPVNMSDPTGLAGCSPALSFADCQRLLAEQRGARADVSSAREKVQGLIKERAEIKAGKRDGLSAQGRATAAALDKAFGSSTNAVARVVERNLGKLIDFYDDPGTAQGGKYDFRPMTSSERIYYPNALAVVQRGANSIGFNIPPLVVMTGGFWSEPWYERAQTMIHEPLHILGIYAPVIKGVEQELYRNDSTALAKQRGGTTAALYNNADNYACFIYPVGC